MHIADKPSLRQTLTRAHHIGSPIFKHDKLSLYAIVVSNSRITRNEARTDVGYLKMYEATLSPKTATAIALAGDFWRSEDFEARNLRLCRPEPCNLTLLLRQTIPCPRLSGSEESHRRPRRRRICEENPGRLRGLKLSLTNRCLSTLG